MKLAAFLKPKKAKTPWGGPSLPFTYVPGGVNKIQDKYGFSKRGDKGGPGSLQDSYTKMTPEERQEFDQWHAQNIGQQLGGLPGARPPKNTRISPGVYADGSGGTVLSARAPGPVAAFDPRAPYTMPDGTVIRPFEQPQSGPFGPGSYQVEQPLTPEEQQRASNGPFGHPVAGGPFVPDSKDPRESAARYAAGGPPQLSTRGDAMRIIPARGTRLSPGIYADGRGGSYRKR